MKIHPKQLLFITSLLSLQMVLPRFGLAAEIAGRVVAVVNGQVTAAGAGGEIRELLQESPIYSGDLISTGPNSRVRIILSDNSVIALRPSTRFVIDDYRYTGDPQQDQSAFSLVRGGFRAITGAIGHANQDNYRIETPTATIGIRGTEHQGRFCASDCFDLVEIGVAAPPDGLYTGTSVGLTVVGGQEFGAGEYGFTDFTGVTIQLPEPPPILVLDPHLQDPLAGSTESSAEEAGSPAGETQDQTEVADRDAQAGEAGASDAEGAEQQGEAASGAPEGQAGAIPTTDAADQPGQPEPAPFSDPPAGDDLEIPAYSPVGRAVNC